MLIQSMAIHRAGAGPGVARGSAHRRLLGRRRPAQLAVPDELPVAASGRRRDLRGVDRELYVITLTTVLALPLGIGAAIYLEEYGSTAWFNRLIEINIANLAGVPSIIYGLLGLGLFVRTMGFGRSVLAGAATLALLVLPIVILATREALRTVPNRFARRRTRWARRSGRRSSIRSCRRAARHSDRPDPRPVSRDRRNRAAHHDRRAHVRAVRARQHLVGVHRPAYSDFRLVVPASGRVRRERIGRHHRPARAPVGHERVAIVLRDRHQRRRA